MVKKSRCKWLFMVLTLVLVAALIAGCDGSSPADAPSATTTDTPSTPSISPQTETKSDRTLYAAATQVNTTFDPWGAINAYDNTGRIQVYDTLVFKDNQGNICGSLAESWDWTSDAKQVTFYLHHGVKFHNGEEMKASDVKFSFDTARQSPVCMNYLNSIEGVEAPDDYTVVLTLNRPNVALLEVLMTYGQIVNEKAYTAAGEQAGDTLDTVIGTGPYKLVEWKPTELTVYEAFDDYFKGAPDIKNVNAKTISDPNAALIALQTGDIDLYLQSAPAIAIADLKSNQNLTVVDITSKRLYYLGMNWEFGLFVNNNLLRQAIAYGVDRDALNIIANEGLGTIIYYPGGPDYSGQPNLANSGYKYDPDKARELVKQAGAEGLKLTIKLENSGFLPEMATALQSQLSAIGLSATVSILEVNAYLQDVYSEGNYDMFVSFTTARTKDMDTVWAQVFHSSNIGQGNSGRYNSPEMDAIVEAARAETNTEARKAIYADGVKIFDADIPYLTLFYEYSNRAFTNDLTIDPKMAEYDCLFYYDWK